jgi:hypothetical protein
MVVQESYITRKPLEFTLILLVIVLILLLPVYFYTKHTRASSVEEGELIAQTYKEVWYMFSSESDITDNDKRHLFRLNYEGNLVQWTGTLLSCDNLDGVYRISVDHSGDGTSDVLFTTYEDCIDMPVGSVITYKIELIDWKTTIFVGKDGEVIKWG